LFELKNAMGTVIQEVQNMHFRYCDLLHVIAQVSNRKFEPDPNCLEEKKEDKKNEKDDLITESEKDRESDKNIDGNEDKKDEKTTENEENKDTTENKRKNSMSKKLAENQQRELLNYVTPQLNSVGTMCQWRGQKFKVLFAS